MELKAKSVIFVHVQVFLIAICMAAEGMKREPGVNPGQTRCCDLFVNTFHKEKPLFLTWGSGKVWDVGKSEDLPVCKIVTPRD